MTNPMTTPASIPQDKHATFKRNYDALTHGTNRLFLFAGDQKIEHLNTDFYGDSIPAVCNNPEHLFTIASKARIGGFATHLGFLARYGAQHPNVNYVVKLNGKTNLSKAEPHSHLLYSADDVVAFAQSSKLNVVGVGYTLYIGSEHEGAMLREAAQQVLAAHRHGLVAIIWAYPRGSAVKDQHHPNALAGAAGVACSLGADFVKLSLAPSDKPGEQAQTLRQAVGAAGNTGVLCAGGASMASDDFITQVQAQLGIAGTRGIAVGRNVYQRSVDEAVALCEQISDLVYGKQK